NPGDETPITICFTVTRAFLDKAKRQDKKLHFSYTVTDQIGNGPDTDAPWSPVQSVDEDLDGTRLPMPILLERKEDYPGDDASIIDLEKLAGNPLLLVVVTADNRFVVGYDVIATYTATNTGQPADVVVKVSGKVEAEFGQKKVLFLEVPNDKIFAGSNVTATYELRKPNGDPVGSSSTANATVTGSTPIDLLPPSLVAPAINPIDVLAYPNGVTVRIEYLGALKADRARLVEVNPPAGSPQFPLVEFNSNKRVNTVLSPAFLAARHGEKIDLFWDLYRNGGQAGKSPATQMSVLKIADGDSRLPSPKVPQAPDDKVLDLNTFEGNADVTVLPWIGISTDNIVTLKLLGKATDNSDCTIPILTNHKITEAEKTSGIKEILMREQLLTLKHDTELKVYFEVIPSPASNLAPIIFPPLNLKLLKVPLVMLEDFETGTEGGVPVGTVMDFPSMVVTVLNGYAIITTQYYTPPFITGKYLYFAPGGTLRFTLKRPAKSIRFGSADASNPPLRYSCYDENIELVKAGSTPVSERPIDVWVEITETPNRTIKFIDITDGRSGSRLDNFSLYY
ncbi:hypothetical protein JJD74_30495, partial [Pseudomonas sp. MF6776]|nr:hypothetical protein [Pseudomonas sp. MF6776]